MTDALRYEWTRIRTIRSTFWLSVIAVTFGVGLSFLVAMGTSFAFDSSQPPSSHDTRMMAAGVATQFGSLGAPYFVAYILAMLGVFAWGHEYRHGMIRATLTALNSRSHAWAAKYVVVGVWVLAVALVTMLGALLAGWLWLHDDGVPFVLGDLVRTVARTLAYTLVFTWLATAFTSLVRNQTAALVLMFLWPLAVENVIVLVFRLVPGIREHTDLTRFLPFTAGGRIIDQSGPAGSLFGQPLSAWGGLVVFGGLAVLAMVASLLLFRRRDA